MPLERVDVGQWVWMMLGGTSWVFANFLCSWRFLYSLLIISLFRQKVPRHSGMLRKSYIQERSNVCTVSDTRNRIRFAGVAEIGLSTSNTKVGFYSGEWGV